MAGLKTIRRRIASVKNTKQITRAMKLVSAAKLRRAQEAAENGSAFSYELDAVVQTLLREASEDFTHPLLEQRSVVKVRRVLLIAGERGLCGAYNANIIKAAQHNLYESSGETQFVPVGKRSVSAARRLGWNIVSSYENLAESAAKWPIDEIALHLMRDFEEGLCDEVVIYYTKFVSALTQRVTSEILLPLRNLAATGSGASTDAADESPPPVGGFSPKPDEMLFQLVPLLVKTRLYQASLQSKASEHAARMTAMDAATSNADELIEKLRLYYNRARQSSITRELLDIVGGAEAIK